MPSRRFEAHGLFGGFLWERPEKLAEVPDGEPTSLGCFGRVAIACKAPSYYQQCAHLTGYGERLPRLFSSPESTYVKSGKPAWLRGRSTGRSNHAGRPAEKASTHPSTQAPAAPGSLSRIPSRPAAPRSDGIPIGSGQTAQRASKSALVPEKRPEMGRQGDQETKRAERARGHAVRLTAAVPPPASCPPNSPLFPLPCCPWALATCRHWRFTLAADPLAARSLGPG